MVLLTNALVDELRQLVQGSVFVRSNNEFKSSVAVFNGNVVSPSAAVVLPLNTNDVSRVLKFCTKHGLSPSVKAGGYGTAGWSVNGDITLDLQKLNDLYIETPSADGFVSLKETPRPDPKGKARATEASSTSFPSDKPPAPSGKRQRSPEATLPRNPVVADFLRLPDLPAPAVRRRLEAPKGTDQADMVTRVTPSESTDTTSSESSKNSDMADTPTTSVATSPPQESRDGSLPTDAKATLTSSHPTVSSESGDVDISLFARISPSENAYTLPAETPATFSVRSNDPFGYMSSSPQSTTASARRPTRGFEQEVYPSQTRQATSSTPLLASNSSRATTDSNSTADARAMLSTTATPIHSKAFVSIGAGVRQKDIDLFTAAHPLPATSAGGSPSEIPYHVPLAAHPVGSSVMLLGGFGFLSRLHGLSVDCLVEAEVVLADGTIVFVSEKENADLWWALRGAGSAFGVVTRYKAVAYPVPVVFAGNLIYNFRAATAASLIKHFRDCIKAAPRELYANVLLTAGPAGKGALIVVQMCYIGTQGEGRAFLQAIASWDGEPCLLNEVCEKTFLSQQDSVAQILRGKAGRQWFIRSALINSLPDDIIHKTVNEFANTPVGCTWLFELAGGAVADNAISCLPKAQREASFTIAAFHQWEMGDDDPLCVTTAEHWIYETLKPVSVGGPYPAFLGRHEKAERIIASYGECWDRLTELKRKYDPKGMFRNSLWPLTADGKIQEPVELEPISPPIESQELPPV